MYTALELLCTFFTVKVSIIFHNCQKLYLPVVIFLSVVVITFRFPGSMVAPWPQLKNVKGIIG